LRGEWGFNGFVLTDYEVGSGNGSYMGTLQTLAAGGDAKLKTVGMDALFGFDISKYPEYQVFGREAAHNILYTVVNSAGMNGFVHGVEYVHGFAYYKLILIGWDILAAAGLTWMGIALVKTIRKRDKAPAEADGDDNAVENQPEIA
jgi:beta-glucosidase